MEGKLRTLPVGAAVLVTLGLTSVAAVPTGFASVASPPKLSLQQAEHIAESTFNVPSSYTLQNESYNSNQSSTQPASYSLSYQDPSPSANGQWINVTIDANTGTILNYNRPTQDNQFVFPVPVTPQKAKQIADTWAQKLYPTQFQDVKSLPLTPSYGSLVGPTRYTYQYERMVGGIPAPFNGFSITIDQDGNLVSLSDNWTDLSFPTAKNAVSQAKANGVYQNALNLHLVYQSIYHTNSKPTTELIYQAAPQIYPNYWGSQYGGANMIEYPVINAVTGQITDATGSTYQPQTYTQPKPLVPGGPKLGVKRSAVNWTQQQAMAYAQKMFNITDSDTLVSVNQYQNPNADTTWNFSWQTGDNMNLQVSVDATYGFVSNFNQYSTRPQSTGQSQQPAKQKVTQAEINNTVTALAKKLFANNTGAIAVVPNTVAKNASTNLDTSFQIVYLVNGVPDQTRGGNIYVNPQTGQVQSLWMNTSQTGTQLPDISKAMPVSEAVSKWMKARPLSLEYLETQPQMAMKFAPSPNGKNAKANQTPEVILAYAPTASQNSSGQFNAITGVFESQGAKTPFSGTIQDLNGTDAAAQLQLLVDRELVSVDSNGDVHPNQTMTHSAFLKLLVDALGYQGRYNPQVLASSAAKAALSSVSVNSPDYHEIGAAYSMGWIPSNQPFDPNALTTRDYAAEVLARALNFTPLLSHPEAFKFNASDAASIPSSNTAPDALAVTLGLFPLENGAFKPNADITLASTAIAVVQAAIVSGEQGQPYPPGPRPMG